MTAQYDVANDAPDVSLRSPLYEVGMLADENGQLWNRRYAKDAWGRPKSVIDESLFAATWTYDIHARVWEEWSYTEGLGWSPIVGFQNASSQDHMLTVKSTTVQGGGCTIATKEHPKYQPNRGHLYSTAIIHPNPQETGLSRFGLGSPKDGVFFEIEGNGTTWDIFAARRFDGNISMRQSIKAAILKINPNFDPSKGHVYDIQFQWRGVGNYYFFVDLQLVYTENVLGNRTQLSMADPALQAFYSSYCTLAGLERQIKVGCVDITSEGGNGHNTAFGSLNSGDTLLSTGSNVSTAMMAIRVPRYVTYEGDSQHINSRNLIMDMMSTYCSKEYLVRVYYFRDTVATNLEALTWNTVPDSRVQYLTGGYGSTLDDAFQLDKANGMVVLSEFARSGDKTTIKNESHNSPFNVTPGDLLVFAVKSLSGTASTTVYYSEVI